MEQWRPRTDWSRETPHPLLRARCRLWTLRTTSVQVRRRPVDLLEPSHPQGPGGSTPESRDAGALLIAKAGGSDSPPGRAPKGVAGTSRHQRWACCIPHDRKDIRRFREAGSAYKGAWREVGQRRQDESTRPSKSAERRCLSACDMASVWQRNGHIHGVCDQIDADSRSCLLAREKNTQSSPAGRSVSEAVGGGVGERNPRLASQTQLVTGCLSLSTTAGQLGTACRSTG